MDASIRKLKTTTFFGRRLTRRQIEQVQQIVQWFPALSRNELSHTVCEHLNWRTATGEDRAYACLKMLEQLERAGVLTLPAKETRYATGRRRAPARTELGEPDESGVEASLEAIGPVRLELADDEDSLALFNELTDRCHPLGYRQPVGCHLRYFIVDGSGRRLGCLLFQRATTKLACRDEWIGWHGKSRQTQLERVVCNSRFLIFPWVCVPNLASHALALAGRRLADDWQARWKVRPVLVETFVDAARTGASYRAGGWQRLGDSVSGKAVYVRELSADARGVLCGTAKRRRARQRAKPVADAGFVQLWQDFVGLAAEVAEEQDSKWRVRKRTVGTLLVMLFVFRLVFSHNRQGYQTTINELWSQCRLLGVALPQEAPVAASAMHRARGKVGCDAFRRLHSAIVARLDEQDDDAPAQRFCGRRLFAVDGTKINLPRELIASGYQVPSGKSHYPQGLVSCLYRVGDRMPVDFEMAAHGNERALAMTHLQYLRAGDVAVYDRGYYSYELLQDHRRRGLDCVFRLPRNSAGEFRRFMESDGAERVVELCPGRDAARRWRQWHPGETLSPVQVRLLRLRTDGEDFFIATTLTDADRFSAEALSDIYWGRWSVEELYKSSKRSLEIEQFHAKSEPGVKQELYAHFTLMALARSFGNELEDAINADGGDRQANFKNALTAVSRHFEALVLGHAERVRQAIDSVLECLGNCVSKRRPGRSYPRLSKRPDERFRNANRRSSANKRTKQVQTA